MVIGWLLQPPGRAYTLTSDLNEKLFKWRSLIRLHVSHQALVGRRGGVLLTQRPLQAGSAHSRRLDEQRAVLQGELLVDAAPRRRDEARLPQQVVVPAVVPVPNLETDLSAEETCTCVTSSTSWPGEGLIFTWDDFLILILSLAWVKCSEWFLSFNVSIKLQPAAG